MGACSAARLRKLIVEKSKEAAAGLVDNAYGTVAQDVIWTPYGCDSDAGGAPVPSRSITMRTSWATDEAPIFSMTRAR